MPKSTAECADTYQFSWAISNVYCPTIWLAKSALLFQLMHIFAPTKTGVIYWAVHSLIWGNLVFYISVCLTTIFECIPQAKIWNPELQTGHCINFNVAYAATGAVNVVSDILISLLPMLEIRRLQLAPNRKLGVAAVFATGVIYVFIARSVCSHAEAINAALLCPVFVALPIRPDSPSVRIQHGLRQGWQCGRELS